MFHPVGWEDTLSGVGRPQALINEDLKQCDYAIFVLHDRWGTPTGKGYNSGTEEEWALAEDLYKKNSIRNIALFFKIVGQRQIRDPGKQLKAVLDFKKKIEKGKQHLFKQYETIEQFAEAIEMQLAGWLRDHERAAGGLPDDMPPGRSVPPFGLGGARRRRLAADPLHRAGAGSGREATMANPTNSSTPIAAPGFDYWTTEVNKLLEAEAPDHVGAVFCAGKAVEVARSDVEWAQATNVYGIAHRRLGKLDEAIAAFTTIAERFSSTIDSD